MTADEQSALTGMIQWSDNTAATNMWNLAGGGPGVGEFDRLAKMTGTTPDPYGAWGDTLTTSLDQLRLLATFVFANPVLNQKDRMFALDLMRGVDPAQAWGVSAGVLPGVAVALKNGWLPVTGAGWILNSVGAVSGGGRYYLIAVLSQNVFDYGYGLQTIESISKLVWNALAPDFDSGPAAGN